MDSLTILLNSTQKLVSQNLKMILMLTMLVGTFLFGQQSVYAKIDNKVTFCIFKYHLDNGTPLCSTTKLNARHLNTLNEHMEKSLNLLGAFSISKGYDEPSYDIPLDIYVISHRMMNDTKLFGSKYRKHNVVGRYIEDKGFLFITYEAGLKRTSTDLPHELAHWANDNLGITEEFLDETLAREFEQYYVRHKQ